MSQSLVLNHPVRGQWAMFKPPGHPKLAFDFLAVDEGKSSYEGAWLLRHILIVRLMLFGPKAAPP